MISVPERVKDALRDGRRLKNYRFVVQGELVHKNYLDIGEINYAKPYYQIMYAYDNTKRCILYASSYNSTQHTYNGWIVWPDSSSQPIQFTVKAYGTTYLELNVGSMPVGTMIYFTDTPGSSTPTIAGDQIIKVSDTDHIQTSIEYYDELTIDNRTLVYESVKFDERMCSDDTLKFGLCEGSSLEFQYFNWSNIRGKLIKCFIDIQYEKQNPGWVTKYSITFDDDTFRLSDTGDGNYRLIIPARTPCIVAYTHESATKYKNIGDENEEIILEYDDCLSADKFRVYYQSQNANAISVQKYERFLWHSIPMGYYTVKTCSRQASTGIFKVTAYNKLMSEYLDQDVQPQIYDMESDGLDNDYITLKSVMSQLLDRYTIQEKQTKVLEPYYAATSIMDGSSGGFKLKGSSTTYYPVVIYQGIHVTLDNSKRYLLEMDKYMDKLTAAVNNIKQAIYENVQNGSTYWETFKNLDVYIYTCGMLASVYNNQKQSYDSGFYYIDGEAPTSYTSDIIAHGNVEKIKYYHGVTDINFRMPIKLQGSTLPSGAGNIVDIWSLPSDYELESGDAVVYEVSSTDLDLFEIPRSSPPQVTLRQLLNAYYSLNCQYGKLDRQTDLFSGVDLNQSSLYPADSLYPTNNLYPGGKSETSFKSWYSKLWTDTLGAQTFRNLVITYKGLDANNVPIDMVLEIPINEDGTTDYYMSDNWLFKNLIWTAADIETFAQTMVTKLQSITWFPFEMWAAGLPYIEIGDMIEIIVEDETHRSYILQRQLSGIQNLQDTYINGTLDIF